MKKRKIIIPLITFGGLSAVGALIGVNVCNKLQNNGKNIYKVVLDYETYYLENDKNQENSDISTGLGYGLGFGIGVPVVALAITLSVLYLKKKQKQKNLEKLQGKSLENENVTFDELFEEKPKNQNETTFDVMLDKAKDNKGEVTFDTTLKETKPKKKTQKVKKTTPEFED